MIKFVEEKPDRVVEIVEQAFKDYQQRYSKEANYDLLMNFYEGVITENK